MVPFADIFGIGAGEDFGDLIDSEIEAALPANAINAGEKFLRCECAVVGVARREAIIASAAIFLIRFFAEITQQFPAPARAALRVMDDLLQLFARKLPLLWIRFLIDELRIFND